MELEELLGAATLDEAKIAARVKAIGELQSAAFKERTESRLAVRRLVTRRAVPEDAAGEARTWCGRTRRVQRRPMGGERGGRGEGGPAGPGDGEDLAEVDPS